MKLIELQNLVGEIYKYFKDQKVPEQDVLELWLDQVDRVKAEGLEFIVADIKANRNSLPTNFPRIITESWDRYLAKHPEKFTRAEEFADYDCPDCHGVGVLHFKATNPENKLKYTYVAICASCSASRKKFGYTLHEGGRICHKTESGAFIPSGEGVSKVASLTKQQIIDKGYEFLEPENKYEDVLEKIPDKEKYTQLVDIRKKIRFLHQEDLARQAEGLIEEGFTKHEALRAVDQAIELRVKTARDSENPGDIIKQILEI